MEFDPQAASPCFTNQPTEARQAVKHFDPWAAPDSYMGKPRQVEDISQVDFRDSEFRQFARTELRPRKIVRRNYDELCGQKNFIVGSSEDE
jgi:hypothetical protein